MTTEIMVTKVGGSLFGYEQMPERVHAWRDQHPAATTIFIGGGGDLVRPLRTAHERFGLNEESSHWLAIRAMTVTSRLLAKLLDVELVERFEVIEQLITARRNAACVLDVEEFLRQREPVLPGCHLPCDWSATSDAIAARIAEVLQADEFVLLKSVDYPIGSSLQTAADLGLVDGHFPTAAAGLKRLRWVNLRAPALDDGVILK
jgi:aspartokinase-like uncharacterized kinase